MRNMSFSITTYQVKNRTKTVTRRLGWHFLKEGDLICAVEKAQGLKKGQKVKKICNMRIVKINTEPLFSITEEDVTKEGFPLLDKMMFIEMFMKANNCNPEAIVNRIEFEYVE